MTLIDSDCPLLLVFILPIALCSVSWHSYPTLLLYYSHLRFHDYSPLHTLSTTLTSAAVTSGTSHHQSYIHSIKPARSTIRSVSDLWVTFGHPISLCFCLPSHKTTMFFDIYGRKPQNRLYYLEEVFKSAATSLNDWIHAKINYIW